MTKRVSLVTLSHRFVTTDPSVDGLRPSGRRKRRLRCTIRRDIIALAIVVTAAVGKQSPVAPVDYRWHIQLSPDGSTGNWSLVETSGDFFISGRGMLKIFRKNAPSRWNRKLGTGWEYPLKSLILYGNIPPGAFARSSAFKYHQLHAVI